MTALHLAGLVLSILAGACFLLTAFGTEHLGTIGLVPLGLLFFVAAVACYLNHHHPHTA